MLPPQVMAEINRGADFDPAVESSLWTGGLIQAHLFL
jgi:hypothetical protein